MIDKNDPRLIDYALGEMTPDEAKQLETELKLPENAEALKALNEFQMVADAAADALAAEPAGQLRTEQREAVVEQATAQNVPTPITKASRFRYFKKVVITAVAACLLVAVAWVSLVTLAPSREAARRAPTGETLIAMQRLEEKMRDQDAASAPSADISVHTAPTTVGDAVSGRNELHEGAEHRGRRDSHRSMTDSAAEPSPAPTDHERETWSENRPATISMQYDDLTTPSEKPQEAPEAADITVEQAPALRYREPEPVSRRPGIPPMPPPRPPHYPGGERYLPIVENAFLDVRSHPLSTFSIDVDTGAYSNVRRFLQQGQLPPPDAVRIEEMVNYFQYDLAQPTGEAPFSVTIEMADCPWAQGHKLARVALQGRTVASEERGPANLVFLIDVSGSMSPANRLPLAKEAMKALLNELQPHDRVAIVTYAGTAQVNLPSTPCTDKATIRAAIDALQAGGGTHGSQGIQQAYRIARENFIPGGINRVLLATDGDFNVGTTSHDALMDLITEKAKSNVFLTVLGFGYGNLKDATLEQLANKGNGNYAYIDTFSEARRVLVDQISGTLVTIAKDVKIQVEFNPQHVQTYRLIGYENRALADRDFNDDTKDAGEIGAGHQVTALYQLVPKGAQRDPGIDPLRYQPAPEPEPVADTPVNPEWMNVKLRYKEPEGDVSRLIEIPWSSTGGDLRRATPDMQFASSVAAFGMMLRNSQHKGAADYDMVMALAESGKQDDPERQAFMDLVVTAKTLTISRH